MIRWWKAPGAVLSSILIVVVVAVPVSAEPQATDQSKEIQQLRNEVEELREEVQKLKAQQAAQPPPTQAAQPPPAQAAQAPAPKGPQAPVVTVRNGGLQVGPVNIKPGGFIEAAGIYRTRNEVADVGSDYNQGIPFKSSSLAYENETRFSARQSRLSLLITGDVNPKTHLGAYYEMDFLASGVTSNSRESFSYTPRSRLLYATLDKDNWGFHLLGGQEWSLLTTNAKGIMPRTELIPLTIDAQYVEGFNWLRVPQFRVVEDFGSGIWVGVSAESPQIVTSPITAPSSGVNYTNPGNSAGLLDSSTSYSNDYIPDFIAKVALDPGWGHYEVKGLARRFTLQVGKSNHDTFGGGGGGAAVMPLVPKYLDLQLSGLVGSGIGRYGSGQLPDAAFTPSLTELAAIDEWQALAGLVAHPWSGNDLYVYYGREHADPTGATGVFTDSKGKFAGAPGYGSPKLVVTGCDTLGGTCQAQTEQLSQITGGFWQDVYKGDYGRFTLGFQGGEIWRDGFAGVGGKPKTNIGIFMTSLRYYPTIP
jgi:hypothetical protein